MIGQRVVAGHGLAAPAGTIASLALELTEHARRLGLTVVRLSCSRIRSSPSKVLVLRDRRGRDWYLRISDHYCPRRTGHEKPHFDLVSRDGRTGFESAIEYVEAVSRGEVVWSVPERSPMRKGQRPR